MSSPPKTIVATAPSALASSPLLTFTLDSPGVTFGSVKEPSDATFVPDPPNDDEAPGPLNSCITLID